MALVPNSYVGYFEEQYWVTGDANVTVYDSKSMASEQISGREIRSKLNGGYVSQTHAMYVKGSYDGSIYYVWAEEAAYLVQSGQAYTWRQVNDGEVAEAVLQRWGVAAGLRSIGIDPLSGEYIDGNFVNYLDFVTYYQPTMKTVMSGNAGRVSDNRTIMVTTILKGMGFNITNNSVYDSWATLAAVDAVQGRHWEITNGDFYSNLINLLSLMPYDSDGAIKSALANTQTYYRNSLITGQKNWEEEQRRIAEIEAERSAAQLRMDYMKLLATEKRIAGIHAINEANKAKSGQATSAPVEKNEWLKALDQVVCGNYSDEVTWLGTGGQVALGILGADLPADIRDIYYDLTHLGEVSGWQLFCDVGSVLPFVGGLKYADEAFELGSTLLKNGDELAGAAGDVAKNAGKAGSSLAESADTLASTTDKLLDGTTMKTEDVLDLASDFLGKGYSEPILGSGRFVSQDGTRVFRMGENDILGKHAGGPHVNFEFLEPNPAKPGKMQVVKDIHIYLED